MNSLAGSVGEGGMNRPMDVAMVQLMLAVLPEEAGGTSGLVWDGAYGNNTHAAILHFQRTQRFPQDSLIQPSDFTIKRLNTLLARLVSDVSPLDVKENAIDGITGSVTGRTGERRGGDGVGLVRTYPYHVVYFHPELGAFQVHGEIYGKYLEMGEEISPLGYPISDERGIPHTDGRVSYFQYGSITWTPADRATVHPANGI